MSVQAPPTWRSGFCNRANPATSHRLCHGTAGELTCVCDCHRPEDPMTVTALPNAVTEPGIYDAMPDAVYHADPVPGGSLSFTGAKTLVMRSPAHYRYEREHGRPDTASFDFGHAAHREVLGAGMETAVIPGPWTTRDAKAAVAEAREQGRTPLKPEAHEHILAMAAAIKAHPVAPLLFANGKPEQSAFWPDTDTGVWRRARFDWLPGVTGAGGRLILADYKSAESAKPDGWARKAADYGYAMQAAWYCDAAVALGLHPDPAFVFVVQEKTPPYVVTLAQLDADAMRIGRYLNRQALDTYAECTRTNRWPGYSDDVELVALPGWYLNNFPEAL